MSFIAYDLIFLVIFALVFTVFIIKKKHNLKRQGIMYLYPTQIGVKLIDKFTKKNSKFLKSIEYIVIASGLFLMISMVWMIASFSYEYLSSPILAQALKVPVLTPLIPYLPELFHLNFLPPFYFTYWIIIIALVAVPHEFAHGIFARLNKIKVHSTGFGFLGPFLAAFVEPNEKQMQKAPIRAQLSILAAGTFANVISTIVAALLLWGFFSVAFAPAGVMFNSYAVSPINLSSINSINGLPVNNSELLITTNSSFINLTAYNKTYFIEPSSLAYSLDNNISYVIAYDDSPAFIKNLTGAIVSIGSQNTPSYDSLRSALLSHMPGDNVIVKTKLENGSIMYTNLTLSDNNGTAFLGIGIIPTQARSGPMGWVYNIISDIKNPLISYDSRLGDFGVFVYDLLWWSVIICVSVALVNMLPVAVFDGGRFFYLMVLAVTKRKNIAEKAFKVSTWLVLALVAALMIKWIIAFV